MVKLKSGSPTTTFGDKLRISLLFAGGEKSRASIIRATCAFDTKKVLEYQFGILVTRCQ